MTGTPICCSVHPDATAGWRCTNEACRQHLCGKCTARLVKLFTCCACGGPARQLTVSRKLHSRAHWWGAAVRYPFGAGLALAVAMASVLAGLGFVAQMIESHPHQLDGAVGIVAIVAIAGYVLVTIDRTARGAESGKLLRFARTLVATVLVWVPSVAYVLLLGVPGSAALRDWVLWVFAGLTLIYLPLVLAVAVTDTSFLEVANPFRMFDIMFRLGKTYVISLVATLAMAALAVVGAAMAAAIRQAIPTPLVQDAVAQLPMLAGLAMLGHVIGMLAHVHGDLMGWGSADLFVDPLFPDMAAEGRRKIVTRPIATRSVDAAVGTSPMAPMALVSPREQAEATKLANALKAGEVARALRLYEARPSWSAASLDDRQLVVLAKAAVRAKKLVLAQALLEEACARNGRSVAQAWLALAQLHAESLGQADRAHAIYRKIVDEFPASDVAKLATAQLGHASLGVTA